jgi:hypothetical protein
MEADRWKLVQALLMAVQSQPEKRDGFLSACEDGLELCKEVQAVLRQNGDSFMETGDAEMAAIPARARRSM